MKHEELITLLEAVKHDLIRSGSGLTELSNACQFAIWHLKGEPSFVERNNRRRAEQSDG